MKSVPDIYSRKLNEQITEKGGFESCKIDGELKTQIEQIAAAPAANAPDVKNR